MRPAPNPYTESVFFLTFNFARRMRARVESSLSDIGISVPEYVALMAINSVGPQSNASLARRSYVSPQAMMKVTSRLTEAGLLARAATPNQREHLLELTESGLHMVDEIVLRLRRIVRTLNEHSSEDEYREFKRMLGEYWRALGPTDDGDEHDGRAAD